MKIAITGNPNSGKTTLFNALTGKNERVGNYHGVTVGVTCGNFSYKGNKHIVYDLPGLNSFDVTTLEEGVSVDFLTKGDYDLIVNVIEAVRIDCAVNLLEDLVKLGKPVLCVVNMTDDLVKKGGNIDFDILKQVNIDFINCNLSKRSSVKKLVSDFILPRKVKNARLSYVIRAFTPPKTVFTGRDDLLTNALFCAVIFVLAGFTSYYLAFGKYGIGKILSDLIIYSVDSLSEKLYALLLSRGASEFLSRLIRDGFFGGIGSLLGFLPPITTLNFILIYLEQSGIISRLSYVFDKPLYAVGLNGRALYALISGFGCTTLAVLSSGGAENVKIKKRLIGGLPFISCSAKLPVYFYIAMRIFKNFSFLAVLFVYICGIAFSFCSFYLSAKSDKKRVPLMIELPTLRINCLKNVVKPLINSVKQFIIKLTTTVMLVSVGVCLLASTGPAFLYLDESQMSESFLALFGKAVTYLLQPIGIFDYKIGTAVFTGIFAKEAVLSTITALGADLCLSKPSALALLMLIAFYPPCLTAVGAICKETGAINALYVFVFQLAFGLLTSYVTYMLVKNPWLGFGIFALSIISCLLFKLRRKNEIFYGKRKN